jgi:hypothetical protein
VLTGSLLTMGDKKASCAHNGNARALGRLRAEISIIDASGTGRSRERRDQ